MVSITQTDSGQLPGYGASHLAESPAYGKRLGSRAQLPRRRAARDYRHAIDGKDLRRRMTGSGDAGTFSERSRRGGKV